MARKISLKNQHLPTIYTAYLTENVTVRDWDLSEHVLTKGSECEVLLEINCSDGVHVRIRTPGIEAPTWFHKKFLTLDKTKQKNPTVPSSSLTSSKPKGTVTVLFKK